MSVIGPPLLPDELESQARVGVRVNSGATTLKRRRINFLNTAAVTWTAADDSVDEEVDLSLAFTADMATQAELDAHAADTTAVHGIADTSVLVEDAVLDARIRAPGTALPASPADGQLFYDTDDDLLHVYNGTDWVCITPVSATVLTQQNTSTTTYTDLATAGPAVSIQTGTEALVTVCCQALNEALMSFAVSGATTRAAADDDAAYAAANAVATPSMTMLITGLTAGVNTFTSKYRRNTAGTATFLRRRITVVGLP